MRVFKPIYQFYISTYASRFLIFYDCIGPDAGSGGTNVKAFGGICRDVSSTGNSKTLSAGRLLLEAQRQFPKFLNMTVITMK